jgi:hypothetical protein
MRTLWITLLAVLAFVAIVISRAPASWVVPAPSPAFACSEVDGTIWDGTCSGLTSRGQSVGELSWEVHAWHLLSGKLNAAVVLTRPTGTARGNVEIGLSRKITARDIQADLPVDPVLMPQLPHDFHGRIHADIALLVATRAGVVKTVQGHIEARNLEQGAGEHAQPLGSYSVVFAPHGGGDPIGQLHDLGGPLSLEGTLRLTPDPGIDLQCLLEARPGAPADLQNELQYLPRDAQGRRMLGFEAAF